MNDKDKVAAAFSAGVVVMAIISIIAKEELVQKYERRINLLARKNQIMHRYIFDEVQNPKALENLYYDAKFMNIISENDL
jgi:hypothetical protein